MARLHGSFLVRWWVLDHGGTRIELEHIQSGAKAVTSSLAEALAWIRLSGGDDADLDDRSSGTEGQREKGGGVDKSEPVITEQR